MTPHNNRYAWTNYGPVSIRHGGDYSTKKVKAFVADHGLTVQRWARNWAEFCGWQPVELEMQQKVTGQD